MADTATVYVPDEFWDVLNEAIADGLAKLRRLESKHGVPFRMRYREAEDGRMMLYVEPRPAPTGVGDLN